jgi:tetratricopeptide (TPR) repeat protein
LKSAATFGTAEELNMHRLNLSWMIAIVAIACGHNLGLAQPPSEARAILVDGLGIYSRPISTDSLAAQRFFDQGLNLTFGYYFVHAVASFQEAIRQDPDSAMPYWGLALALGPTPNSRYLKLADDPQKEGKRAIGSAMRLRDRASEVERELIETLFVRYDDETYPERNARDEAYIAASRRLHEKRPADLDAAFLYADAIMTPARWDYWDAKGNPRPGITDAAAALQHVVDLHPLHPGANHLYIHLFEASPTPGRALPHADRLAALMPKAGHIVHMPSHIYIRVGQYAKAIETNRRSVEADDVLLEAWGDHPFPEIGTYNVSARNHRGHANGFIRFASTLQGNYARAIEHARLVADSVPLETMLDRNQRQIATVWLVHKIFGQWDALDKEPAPPGAYPYLQGMWRYAHGSKHVHRGDLAAAELALAELRRLREHPDIQDFPIRTNPGAKVLEIAAHGLAGEIAVAARQFDTAIESFRTAVAAEDALSYVEPPDWAQSMRLYLGHAYLKAKQPEMAEAVYREELNRFPENGWALCGLWLSLEAQGKSEQVRAIKKRFDDAWQFADVALAAPVF